MTYVWVALGSALGGVARFGCAEIAVRLLRPGFPWSTLFVNVSGSLTIGVLTALVAADGKPLVAGDARAFLVVGILGGFTTFSSFSLETLTLARNGAWLAATTNVAGSVALCLAAVALGYFAGSRL